MKILIDNGHGSDDLTQGKFSPAVGELVNIEGKPVRDDKTVYAGRFREGNFNRLAAAELVTKLRDIGLDAERIVLEDKDVSLGERVRRVNAWCKKLGARNVVFISVHANAAGSGEHWMSARGFSVHVAKNASTASKQLAVKFTDRAVRMGLKGNRVIPMERYWANDFYVIKNTLCPAVLTENLFYDNKDDLAILASPSGRGKIVDLHVRTLQEFLATR